ncbi:uncharacterized protein [Nicotiana sylvestris]|uniref:uncharacterized protein n=1 Tax=Nicotiana sylvestris TaxID=4096 RepID=UPI00388CC690
MSTGKLAKWQILLSKFNIIYVTQRAVKGQALADHLDKNPVGGAYETLKTYFPDEEVSFVGEDIIEVYDGWRMFFDGAANFKGVGIGAVLVSEMGQHYPVQGEWATKNSKILPYMHHVRELRKRFTKIEFRHVPRIQNEFADALATLPSMIQHPDKNYIHPILVRIHNQLAYCAHVEEEADGKPWFHDIKKFVEAKEVSELLEDVHVGTCGPHMNGFVLAKKIFRAGYFWMTIETDCIKYVCKYFQSQVHANMIKVPPNELNATSSPWSFAAWGMDVNGPIELTNSNGRRFILVAIDYFTKWVEAASYKALTKKVITDFAKDHIVCRFEVLESIITDNATNINSDLMKAIIFFLKQIQSDDEFLRGPRKSKVRLGNQ